MSQFNDTDERSRENRKRIEALERAVKELCQRNGMAWPQWDPRLVFVPLDTDPAAEARIERLLAEKRAGMPKSYLDNPTAHCWQDHPDGGATCLLSDSHDEPHEWTRDTSIAVKFAQSEPKKTRAEAEMWLKAGEQVTGVLAWGEPAPCATCNGTRIDDRTAWGTAPCPDCKRGGG